MRDITKTSFLKFKHPYSLAPMPTHLSENMDYVSPRPSIKLRKNIHSYLNPAATDLLREVAKT